MMNATKSLAQISLLLKLVLIIILILIISLGIFYLLLQPSLIDIRLMASFLSVTAVISWLAGYGAYRLGWVERSPSIRWTLLGGYFLSSLLTFVNVWITAALMFTNQHDLLLATVLLIFAATIAIALGYILSIRLTDRIRLIEEAAQKVSQGDLDVQLPVTGRDEMAGLASTFNQMTIQLSNADRKQRELDNLKRDLISWVGHDLHTPLASIRAIIEALADGMVEDQDTVQRYLSTAQKEIKTLSLLIDDLFQMSQLDTGGLPLNKELNSMTDLVSDTLESFSELATKKGINLKGEVTAGVDPVLMDGQRISRVLDNLLSNALRYTSQGGEIELRVESKGKSIQVEVSNTGEQIEEKDLPFLFERFYRGEKSRSRSTGGSGLGLAIAKGIVEAHGGQIDVESRPGLTRFFFTLPT